MPPHAARACAKRASRPIDLLARNGFDQVKIYGSIEPAPVPCIAGLAHARGLRVGGRMPGVHDRARRVEAGFDEVDQIN